MFEAEDDDLTWKVKQRLARAHAKMGEVPSAGDQARRDRMARIMQDPDAARVMFREPEADWSQELPGQSIARGAQEIEPEPLPKPDQPAPGTASGIGAARIAARQATPTSVSLGAKARQIEPGASTIKSKLGVSPDAFFGNVPLKQDPETGKLRDPRGRPKKSKEQSTTELEASIDRLEKLLQNPKTDRHAQWLKQQIKTKKAELEKLKTAEPKGGDAEFVHEPFAAQQAKAMAKSTTPKGDKPNVTSYDAGPWAQAQAHLPKGGEIRSTGKSQGIGKSTAGSSKLTATDDRPRKGAFHGDTWSPAGFTEPEEDEWSKDPAVAARRVGGTTGKRMSFPQQATGQRGRMGVQATPGKGTSVMWNQHIGQWQSPEDFERSNADMRAKLAAKLAMRGAAQANLGRRPWAGTQQAPGQVVPKDAATQSASARAAAIASKPLPVNIRRDPEAPQHKPAAAAPEKGSTQASEPKAIDRDELKRRIAQRLAKAAAAKKTDG